MNGEIIKDSRAFAFVMCYKKRKKAGLSNDEIEIKTGCNAPGRKETVMMENQLAEVMVENEITYRLAEDGCYYPQLSLEQKTDYMIGKVRHHAWRVYDKVPEARVSKNAYGWYMESVSA